LTDNARKTLREISIKLIDCMNDLTPEQRKELGVFRISDAVVVPMNGSQCSVDSWESGIPTRTMQIGHRNRPQLARGESDAEILRHYRPALHFIASVTRCGASK
jgi:hypothetical protein